MYPLRIREPNWCHHSIYTSPEIYGNIGDHLMTRLMGVFVPHVFFVLLIAPLFDRFSGDFAIPSSDERNPVSPSKEANERFGNRRRGSRNGMVDRSPPDAGT